MPDIVFISRIMDKNMAKGAVDVALSGRLAIGTTHAYDTTAALIRLMEYNVEPQLLVTCLQGIISQRLIRLLCPHCKEPYQTTKEEMKVLGIDKPIHIYRAKGCNECYNIGYLGRGAIFEIFKIKEGLRDLIIKKAPAPTITRQAEQSGMVFLKEEGIKKVKKGLTTLEELQRVLFL
jgi:type IV pilus assembly protein PilB